METIQTDSNEQTPLTENTAAQLQTVEVLTTKETPETGKPDDLEEEEEPAKPLKRHTKTAIFTPEEFKNIDQVFNARFEAGISNDYNHFIRQCIDFAINSKHVKGAVFASPDLPQFFINNGFFHPNNKY